MIYTYGVNIPFFDDWAFVDMIDRYLSGNLTFQDIWAQHNEHRPVTMKIVRLISAAFTKWDLVSEMMFSGFVAFMTFLIIALQISRTCAILDIRNYGLPLIFAALSLAGISQYENWMWGIATHWFLANFFAVSSFFLLVGRPSGFFSFALAALCAVLSFMSMAHGFLALFLGIFLLMLTPADSAQQTSAKRIRICVWMVITVSASLIYASGYSRPEHHPPLTGILEQPVVFLKYVAAYPASSILRDMETEALIFGAISLAIFGIAPVEPCLRADWKPGVGR